MNQTTRAAINPANLVMNVCYLGISILLNVILLSQTQITIVT